MSAKAAIAQERSRYLVQRQLCSSITESCIGFYACEGLAAVSLSKTILDCLRDIKIDFRSGMVGQCYDDASVMRRIHRGAQSLIKEVAPLSFYAHCHAHRLNLVVVAVCTNMRRVTDMLHTIRSLHKFFSATIPARPKLVRGISFSCEI